MTDIVSAADIGKFVTDGFLRLDDAFPPATAEEARAILWRECGCDPMDRASWTAPVVRLGERAEPPFATAASSPRLVAALDQLVGRGRWQPRHSLGAFVLRFPVGDDPGDTGWHVDAGFPGEAPADYMRWRINLASRGRALLMLFLFSDVGVEDAPTRIRVGSHRDVARILAPAGEAGLAFMELAERLDVTAQRPMALATGAAGTVYLCHPFLVHAAQPHRGRTPRFLAQPALFPAVGDPTEGNDLATSPVDAAVQSALEEGKELVRTPGRGTGRRGARSASPP